MAVLPDDRLLLWNRFNLYSYDLSTFLARKVCEMDRIVNYQGRKERTWEHLQNMNVRPYVESLVRISA